MNKDPGKIRTIPRQEGSMIQHLDSVGRDLAYLLTMGAAGAMAGLALADQAAAPTLAITGALAWALIVFALWLTGPRGSRG